MISLKQGSQIPFPEKIFEQFEVSNNTIYANVSVEKVGNILKDFIRIHNEPLFLILEIPTNEKDEQRNENGEIEISHKDVYYLDGCSQEEAVDILNRYGTLLIHDGLTTFGFGGHNSNDEILFGKYNIMTVFSKDINGYIGFFKNYNFEQVDSLVTAWDTFSEETYGTSTAITVDDTDIYAIPELLKEQGMYFAERREEY